MQEHCLITGILLSADSLAAEKINPFEKSCSWEYYINFLTTHKGLFYLYDIARQELIYISYDPMDFASVIETISATIESCEGHYAEIYPTVTFCTSNEELEFEFEDIILAAMQNFMYPTIFYEGEMYYEN